MLSASIDKFCYLTIRELPPFFEHRFRIVYGESETVSSWQEVQHPVVREVLRVYRPKVGLEIHHDGDLPARSGIGSSAAFSVGILKAMDILSKRFSSPETIAARAIRLETMGLLEFGGWQDQIACSLGGLKFIRFHQDRTWTASSVPLSESRFHGLFSGLVLLHLGTTRQSSDVSEGLRPALLGDSSELEATAYLAEVALADLVRSSDEPFEILGRLFDEAWVLKERVNPLAVTPRMKEARKLLLSFGASGVKVSGAGGGGFVLCAVDPQHMQSFCEKASSIGTVVPFRPESQGSQVVFHDGEEIDMTVTQQSNWYATQG